MTRCHATVSVDGIIFDWSLFHVLEGVALLVFLLGAVRMQQARRAAHWVRLGWGFGMLLGSVVYGAMVMAGLLEVSYWPGMSDFAGYAYDLPEVRWWEPYVWWGNWFLRLGGMAFVALGFFGAAREMARERIFPAPGGGKGGRRA